MCSVSLAFGGILSALVCWCVLCYEVCLAGFFDVLDVMATVDKLQL